MNNNFVVFHAGSDNSYMSSVTNFRGGDVGTAVIDLFFEAAAVGSNVSGTKGYDKVTLTVTGGEEEAALELIGQVMAGGKAMTVIADDINTKYIHQGITGITSITLSAVGSWLPVTAATSAPTLTAGDSGKVFFTNPAATMTYTLPAISAALTGWNCTFIVTEGIDATATGMDNIVNIHAGAGNDDFIGIILDSNDGAGDYAVAGDDYINITDSAGPGSRIDIICDGSRYYAYGTTNEQAQCLFAASAAA